MKHLFIVNPAAGKCDRSVQVKALVDAVFGSRGLDYEVQVSKAPGDCTRLARQASETGGELRVYACGGDGTLHEVINGVAGFDHVAVTHFPVGSGNDFVKLFDRPEAFRELESLLDIREAQLDLICCQSGDETRYSANICSLGLDARIGTALPRYRRLPLVSGTGAYYISVVANLFKGISRPYTIDVDGRTISGDQTLVCICNGRFYGGSFNPVPDASPDDGLLDVLIIKPVNLLQVATIIGEYQKGHYAKYPHLIDHFRTDRIRVQSEEESVVNLDGEALYSRDITFSVLPGRLRFFYPQGVHMLSTERKEELAGAF